MTFCQFEQHDPIEAKAVVDIIWVEKILYAKL